MNEIVFGKSKDRVSRDANKGSIGSMQMPAGRINRYAKHSRGRESSTCVARQRSAGD